MEIKTSYHAQVVAREFALKHGVSEGECEAYADVWFDAVKDDDGERMLRRHLANKFNLERP